MPASNEEKEFVAYVVELMQATDQSLSTVNAKAMFGGYGIFLDGLMFALVAESVLYFKVDTENKNLFINKDLPAFTYIKKGKEFSMSYFQAPEEALEDADEMNRWAKIAYGAALRAAHKKGKK